MAARRGVRGGPARSPTRPLGKQRDGPGECGGARGRDQRADASWTRSVRRASWSGSVRGQHAVAEVEHVALGRPAPGQRRRGRGARRPPTGRAGSPGRGCPAAPCRADPARGLVERHPPVDADDVGPGLAQQAEQLAGADAEVDARHAEVGQPGEDRGWCGAGRTRGSRAGRRAPTQESKSWTARGARRDLDAQEGRG